MKRFKVKNSNSTIARVDTLLEAVEVLRLPANEYENLYVEDVIDDIEVSGDEILAAFASGEAPGDLQYF